MNNYYLQNLANVVANFDKNIETAELCKGVHFVDLGESFQTHIYYLLANLGFDTAENEPCKVGPIEGSLLTAPKGWLRTAGR